MVTIKSSPRAGERRDNRCGPSSPSSRAVTDDAPGGHQPRPEPQRPCARLCVRPGGRAWAVSPCALRHRCPGCGGLDPRSAPPRKGTWGPGGLRGGQAPKQRAPLWGRRAPLWKSQMSDTEAGERQGGRRAPRRAGKQLGSSCAESRARWTRSQQTERQQGTRP